MKEIIKSYLQYLEAADYTALVQLFASDAVVHSPLYGERPAREFFRELFRDTERSILTPLHLFYQPEERTGAAHFLYEWVMNNDRHVSFEVVDIFTFNKEGKILSLKIIYDTVRARGVWEDRTSESQPSGVKRKEGPEAV